MTTQQQTPPGEWVMVPKELLRQLKHYTACYLDKFPHCGAPTEKEIGNELAAPPAPVFGGPSDRMIDGQHPIYPPVSPAPDPVAAPDPSKVCGCGRPVQYRTTAGDYACNKYIRCKTPVQVAAPKQDKEST